MQILVTNDDGVDAPGLLSLARAVADLGEVTVVVPDRERSWVGKAITRFDPVHVEAVERDGMTIHAVSGYPADAVQLAVHTLELPRPDLVVSGINLGYNHGAGFLMSSGTVGAAIEAWIAGTPAVALSTGTMGNWHEWRARAETEEAQPHWERLAEVSVDLIREIEKADLYSHADAVSVNLPFDADTATARRITTIARVGYDRLFQHQSDGSYRHAYTGGITEFDVVDGSDIDAAHDGVISITPLRLPAASIVPDEVRAALER